MQAHSQMVVLPLPRGIAIANSPPRSTACSILAITFRVIGPTTGRWNVSGKYESQKNRKSAAAFALRSGFTTSGNSPMSRPASASAIARCARARSFSVS